MPVEFGDPAYGWNNFGGFTMQSGQTIRMGLMWPGDAGPVYLSASSLTIPTTLTRESSIREIKAGPSPYNRSTTEWITVTATSTEEWIEDILISYLGTNAADDIIGGSHGIVPPAWRYHVIAGPAGRLVGWLKVAPPLPGQPIPLIGAAHDDHTVHADVDLDDGSDDPRELAELLSARL
jgi:hypothetical protein